MSEYLTSEEAASRLRISPKTLANWRVQQVGPSYCKLGGHVRYAIDDLDRYVNGARAEVRPNTAKRSPDRDGERAYIELFAGLSRRAQTALRYRDINSIEELRALRPENLVGTPNCGPQTIKEILRAVASCSPPTPKKATDPLDGEIERLVKAYGFKRVLCAIGNLV